MAADLEKLLEQAAKLQAQIEAARAEGKDDGIEQIRSLMTKLGITPEELGFYSVQSVAASKRPYTRTFPPKAVHQPVEPKYRDPATGTTWSGRGKPPRWLQGNRDDYLIQKAA